MKGGMKDPGMKGGMYEKRKGKIDTWMQEGREERKHEKKEGSIPQVSEKGPKNPTSTPESTKKCAKIDQNGAKIDPKGSQNEAKTDKKSEQRLQGDLGPPGGRFHRYPLVVREPFGAQSRGKMHKKSDAKNH